MKDSTGRGHREASSGLFRSASTNLIERLKTQDEEAWQRLLDLYVPVIFSWCRRSGMQAQDSADVVQEVFQAVMSGIAKFHYSRPDDTFRGWLRTITRNKIRDHFRNQSGRPVAMGGADAHQRFMEVAEIELEVSSESGPIASLVHRALDLIRAEFEDRTWQAFWLAAVGQQRCGEIARQLGMTAGAVRQAKYKVLRRLRQELGDVE